ncbi:DUF1636 family protein [Xinfangfangia pollutisoli]|uniref:DUF1636 family protein n=1 Tax=Xinfangfangia pollutisoli TaxID=2865960 RepID=UPI001CD23337|nr:DUF1636 family protein [Xinfangfangia pollutisoli]
MDHPMPPLAARSCPAGAKPAAHQIHLCQICRHTGQPCRPGLALLAQLHSAIALAGLGAGFELSGSACPTSCTRPCTLAWRASAGAMWLFGDVAADADIDALTDLATRCQSRAAGLDGGAGGGAGGGPAAIIVTRAGPIQ